MNLYAYGANGPVNIVDILGLACSKADGSNANCRSVEEFIRCIADASLNYGVGFIPGVGIIQAATGMKVNLFQKKAGTFEYGGAVGHVGSVAGVGGGMVDERFESLGGQDQLQHYDELASRNGLGRSARGARSTLSALKTLGKSLGGIGNLLSAIDYASDLKKCYDKNM